MLLLSVNSSGAVPGGKDTMKGTLTKISEAGLETTVHLDRAPTLADLQERVDGYIEVIPGFDTFRPAGPQGVKAPCVAFCNEEGLLRGFTLNHLATHLWVQCHGPHVVRDGGLVGPIVVVQGDAEFMGAL